MIMTSAGYISVNEVTEYIMMTSSNGNIFCVTGPLYREFTGYRWIPSQRPVTWSFDVFFDLHLNKRLSKQSWGWWFEMPSFSLWRPIACQWGPVFEECISWVINRKNYCIKKRFDCSYQVEPGDWEVRSSPTFGIITILYKDIFS